MNEQRGARWLARAGIAGLWVLLNGSSAGQWVIGVLLALLLPLPAITQSTHPTPGPPRRLALGARLRLCGRVAFDIVVSGIQVMGQVLRPRLAVRSAWLEVPLTTTHPTAHALLASCISLTPGTISVAVLPDQRVLVVHALHVDDAEATVQGIHTRYQVLLEEIYG